MTGGDVDGLGCPTDPVDLLTGDAATFATESWGRRPHIHRSGGDDRRRITGLLTPTAIDEFIGGAARRPTVRMVRDGANLDPATYTITRRLGGRTVDDLVSPTAVAARLADGATLVLQSVHRIIATVADFSVALESAMSHPVQANAYVTPSSARGLAEHSDPHDVFVVQTAGCKNWTVEGIGSFDVGPGDVVYIPAGTRHSASTTLSGSVHVTFGIIRVTYRQVIDRMLADRAPELDEPLPIGYARSGRTPSGDFDEGLVAHLRGALEACSTVDVAELRDAEIARSRRPRRDTDVVVRMFDADHLGFGSVVAWRGTPRFDRVGDRLGVTVDGRRLEFPRSADRALHSIGLTTVGNLPALDPDSRLVVARRLVREGLCSVVDGRRRSGSTQGTPGPPERRIQDEGD